MINNSLFSSKTGEWETPQAFFDELNREFNFDLDPCADNQNAKCSCYFTKQQNGLVQDWSYHRAYVNPPYGRELPKWVKKTHDEVLQGNCEIAVMLIPARTDTSYFHDYIYGKAEIRFIRGRLKFGNSSNNAPFPSMLVIFKKRINDD